MAKLTLDWDTPPGQPDQPRRGDVMQAAKTRYHVVAVRKIRRRVEGASPRFAVTVLRQAEIEPEMEAALERSAARRGGRRVLDFHWYPRKKKRRSFEDLMRGK